MKALAATDEVLEVYYFGSTKEYVQCSERGVCDDSSGFCTCYDTYRTFLSSVWRCVDGLIVDGLTLWSITEGGNCDTTSATLFARDNFPAHFIREISPTYQGDIINIEAKRTASSDFNFLLATANDVAVSSLWQRMTMVIVD